ncbi:MAG: ammonium transporter [Clostridiales bacterium]|nr:ammonium transporter [Clostridiales bacterium]
MTAIDHGDTAFVLMSTALVLFMVPGVALFYGGLVRSKNVLSTMMHSLFAMGIVSVTWALIGYTIAFGSAEWELGALIGGFGHLALADTIGGVTGTIPTPVFVAFQGMFAVITAALISGALAERMKFSAYAVFIGVWSIVVYAPLAHWVWGGGWLYERGALDFAGGTVVHIASAAAALAGALALGKRNGNGNGSADFTPHNLPMTVLGTGMLWFGWFGFNAGSALAANELAGTALLATHLAAACGMLGWLAMESLKRGKPTTLGAASGAVAGLVGITPAAGFVTPMAGMAIGLAAGALCFLGISLKERLGFDDALDVVGIHGVGGTVGALLTGVFATALIAPGLAPTLAEGRAALILEQAVGVGATIVFSFVASAVILKLIDATIGLRVDEDAEENGCDRSEHAERGYVW